MAVACIGRTGQHRYATKLFYDEKVRISRSCRKFLCFITIAPWCKQNTKLV